MLVHDNLNPCSYKGQIFYLEREALTTGRKIQTFELPGTNLREVQDLGAFPDKLALEMIVFDDGTGNLKDEVETFKTLLSDQTPGELTTWLYNTQQVKVEGTYQINMRSTDIGIARISVTFAALEEPAEDEFLNLQELDSDVSFALGFGSDALALLEIPGIVADNFAELAGTLDLYSLELVNLTRKFLFVDEIQSIASSINILSNTLITTPEAIASQFTELFDTIRRSQTDIENTIGFFEELTPFRTEKGDLLAPKSVANRELMEDLESIVAAMSLAVYYEYLLRSDITFKPDLKIFGIHCLTVFDINRFYKCTSFSFKYFNLIED